MFRGLLLGGAVCHSALMKKENSSEPSTQITARQCAVQLLADVLERKRSFDEALAHHNRFTELADRDRNFTRLLVLTTLRRLGQIDALLASMLNAPLRGRTQDVQHVLRLGVAQLLWLKTPAHAAVNEMVDTVASLGHASMKGVANAVLKRVAREGETLVAAQDEAALNVPSWLLAAWETRFGGAAARSIALARLQEAPLDLSVKHDAAGWAQRLGGRVLPTGTVRLERAGKVESLSGYAEGEWWVQDMAAALPVRMLGDVRGLNVLDLCAAPGGKTAQLAAAGAIVTAVDQSARRLHVLRSNLERLALKAECIEADALKWKCPAPFDAILLDAPCSATGTLRRHPELVWHRAPEDMLRLVDIQKRLLRRAAAWLKPGGRLVYAVCSLQEEEGAGQVRGFLAAHPAFRLSPAPGLPEPCRSADGALVTHPGIGAENGGMDGFYAALLVR